MERPSQSTVTWPLPLGTGTANGDRAYVVVKHSWCEDKCQQVEVDLLAKCKDDFSTPGHHYSLCPTNAQEEPVERALSSSGVLGVACKA